MSDFLDHVEQSISSRRLFRDGQPVLVAVSGGLDSMVLLHALHELAEKHGWKLTVAHFNHQLRGRSSDADEGLVRRTAAKLGLRVAAGEGDVRKFAKALGVSIEMGARKLRHDFLARTASRLKIPTIALAHHADDQLELFFLRLLRGSGGEGLAGMKWRNPSPSNSRLELVRPLLALPKSSLREFAKTNGIRFREDASNNLIDMQRNRIRHELLPLLRKNYQPSLHKTVFRAMDIIGAETEFATSAALDWLKEARQRSKQNAQVPIPFDKLPIGVQRRVVHLQLPGLKIKAEQALIETLRLAPNCAVAVAGPNGRANEPERHLVLNSATGLLELKPAVGPRFRSTTLAAALVGKTGEICYQGVRISWRIVSRKWNMPPKFRAGCETFDAEKVGPQILVRHWQPGDRFQPIGMANPMKLQDFFTNLKVPRTLRHELLVALGQTGEVFWVEGMRISERFKLTSTTRRGLEWRWKRM